MKRISESQEETAKRILQSGQTPYIANITITINTITEVSPAGGKTIFLTLQSENFIEHTKPVTLPDETLEEYPFKESLNFHTVLGGSDGFSSFAAAYATFLIKDKDNGRVRDYGVVNFVEFVNGGAGDWEVGMKLGGSLAVTVDCVLKKWENFSPVDDVVTEYHEIEEVIYENPSDSSEEGSSECASTCSESEPEFYEVLQQELSTGVPGEVYRTQYSGGEWEETPLIHTLRNPRLKFWSIAGPPEADSSSDEELEAVCEEEYRIPRSRRKECKVGEIARVGRISRLQKFRVWACDDGIGCKEEEGEADGAGVMEDGGGSTNTIITPGSDDSVDGDVGCGKAVRGNGDGVKRRISDCSTDGSVDDDDDCKEDE